MIDPDIGKRIVSGRQMAEIDQRAKLEYGFPSIVLMENAGASLYRWLRHCLWHDQPRSGKIVFVCGRGNNAGDAFVIARKCYLDGFTDSRVVLGSGLPHPGTDPATNLSICRSLGVPVLDYLQEPAAVRREITEAAWLIDGVAGTGLNGELRGPLRELVEAMNDSSGVRIAIDVPSGVGDGFRPDSPALDANTTVTIELPKLSLYLPYARKKCGRIRVVPLGVPAGLTQDSTSSGRLLRSQDLKDLVPRISSDSHKNTRGHLATFAGSIGTLGAARLCTAAAARGRVGLVTLFADSDAYPLLASSCLSIMCRPWSGRSLPDELADDRYSGILVGPGWGTEPERRSALRMIMENETPGVIDADAITLLAQIISGSRVRLGCRWVLTPHPGEYRRLSGEPVAATLRDPLPGLLKMSADLEAVVVLKGHVTYLAAPDGAYSIVDGMNPALATAGSGDVLAGVIAAGVAAGIEPYRAACIGVLVHARAGRDAYRKRGWFMAEDLLPHISEVFRDVERENASS